MCHVKEFSILGQGYSNDLRKGTTAVLQEKANPPPTKKTKIKTTPPLKIKTP